MALYSNEEEEEEERGGGVHDIPEVMCVYHKP